ncbi:MAG: hypothetical protein EU531_04505 [Promethearchaeota archaeon]|nr:MAG: hypothetical protein EU531_04505 [Candidatus Lokiarchaeota archaeon]
MSNSQGFKRYPAIRCWICHVLEGRYIPEERIIDTSFGKLKRLRILATILKKEEYIFTDSFDEDQNKVGLKFTLDDGTGLIVALVKNSESEQFKNASIGDLVDIVGIVTTRNEGSFVISPTEIMRKIENPDYKLLRDADIIGKIQLKKKTKPIKKTKANDKSELKEQIFEIIEQYSEGANGISFNELLLKLKINDEELRKIIRDLEIDLRIYPSEEDVYQCF